MKYLLAILFLFPLSAHAALTVGTPTLSNAASFSHTVGADVPLLIVNVQNINVTYATITGVTYGGVAMTLAGSGTNIDERTQGIFYLVSPTAGSATVAISYSAATLGQRNLAVDITGAVDTADPIGATYYANEAGNKSKTMTPEASSGVFLSNIVNPTTFTVDTVTEVQASTAIYTTWQGAVGKIAHTGSNTVVAWNMAAGTGAGHFIAEIKEVSAAVSSSILASILAWFDS